MYGLCASIKSRSENRPRNQQSINCDNKIRTVSLPVEEYRSKLDVANKSTLYCEVCCERVFLPVCYNTLHTLSHNI